MENVSLFYGHLVYFTAIWYILRPFGIFYGHLVYFWQFGTNILMPIGISYTVLVGIFDPVLV
jgi:hypothetical protein